MPVLRSWFWRGGVCNALVFRKSDLPADRSQWHGLFARAMGSPDPFGRQLNGMGGGASSLSKICVVSPSVRHDADVDFEFVQIVIKEGTLDFASNCGNMIAAIGPFALDQGMLQSSGVDPLPDKSNRITIRIFNTNTKKIIMSTFSTTGQPLRFLEQGPYRMDGVPGTGSEIALSFLKPGGTQTRVVFPTGDRVTPMHVVDLNGNNIMASLVDVANPAVYVDGAALGIAPEVTPAELDQLKPTTALLERIRREAAERMGLDPDIASVPKIIALFPPGTDALGRTTNIRCIVMSMGQAHKAMPLTIALSLAVACRIEGTLAYAMTRRLSSDGRVLIEHPSGTIEIGTDIVGEEVRAATIYSTARLLMRGEVNVG